MLFSIDEAPYSSLLAGVDACDVYSDVTGGRRGLMADVSATRRLRRSNIIDQRWLSCNIDLCL